MLCPGIAVECDNPGCRHGGCQGRLPIRNSQIMAATVTGRSAGNETELAAVQPGFEIFHVTRARRLPAPAAA